MGCGHVRLLQWMFTSHGHTHRMGCGCVRLLQWMFYMWSDKVASLEVFFFEQTLAKLDKFTPDVLIRYSAVFSCIKNVLQQQLKYTHWKKEKLRRINSWIIVSNLTFCNHLSMWLLSLHSVLTAAHHLFPLLTIYVTSTSTSGSSRPHNQY